MIQNLRTMMVAPLLAFDLTKSGNDWVHEFLLSNHQNDLKKFGNVFCAIKPNGEHSYFKGRLLFSSLVQTENVEQVLNEKLNIGNQNVALFRLNNPLGKRPTNLTLGLAVFQHDTDENNLFKNDYTILAVTQDADDTANYQIVIEDRITARDASFFRSLNNNHTDIIKLANALIAPTRMYADDGMVIDLVAKKLVDDLEGVLSSDQIMLHKTRKDQDAGLTVWQEVSAFVLLFGSQIEVRYTLNKYNPVNEAMSYKDVNITVYDKEMDGTELTESLDLHKVAKQINIEKLFTLIAAECQRQDAR